MFGRLTILLKSPGTVLSPDCMCVRTRDGLIHGLQWGGLKYIGWGGAQVCTYSRCGEAGLHSCQLRCGCWTCSRLMSAGLVSELMHTGIYMRCVWLI